MSKKEEQKQLICRIIISLGDDANEIEITRDTLCRGTNKIVSEGTIKKLFGKFSTFKNALKKALSETTVSPVSDDDDDWGDDEETPRPAVVTPVSEDDDDWGDDEEEDWEAENFEEEDEDDEGWEDEDEDSGDDEDDDWEDDDPDFDRLPRQVIETAMDNSENICGDDMEEAYSRLGGEDPRSFEEEAENVRTNANALAEAANHVLENEAWKSIKVFNSTGNSVRIKATSRDTIRDVLDAAGIAWEGFQVRMDGEMVDDFDAIPEDRSIITVTTKIKGNMEETQKKVKVFDTNGNGHLVRIDTDATVAEILESVGINPDAGYTVMLNSTKIDDLAEVPGHKSVITVGEKIKGNAEAYVRVKLIPHDGVAKLLRPTKGTTVQELLDENGIDVDRGVTVMVNSEKIEDLDAEIADKSIITVAEKIKGNL